MNNLKKIGIAIVILIVVFFGAKGDFIVVNEIGYMGMDVGGRQVFLQTLDHMADDDTVTIGSDFYDRTFVSRLLFGAPMRTTIRYNLNNSGSEYDYQTIYRRALDTPANIITDLIGDDEEITLSNDYKMTGRELGYLTKRYGIDTFEDLLVSFGFKKLDVYLDNNPVATFDLNNKGNTVVRGGLLQTTKAGYQPEKMKEDYAFYDEHGSFPPDYEL